MLPLLAGLLLLFFVLFIVFHSKCKCKNACFRFEIGNFTAPTYLLCEPSFFSDTTLLGNQVCTTHDCIEAANTLLEVMDRQKDPCQDFFAYACGKFDQSHPLPDDRIVRSWFEEGEERLMRMVQEVLEDRKKPTTLKSLKMARQFYHSCVNKGRYSWEHSHIGQGLTFAFHPKTSNKIP